MFGSIRKMIRRDRRSSRHRASQHEATDSGCRRVVLDFLGNPLRLTSPSRDHLLDRNLPDQR
jgi:hypothetical protein